MARIIKEAEHTEKRNKILDFALGMIYSKGYEQTSIQDILDGMKISRGALYHYFGSKQDILEALVEHISKQAEQMLLSVVESNNLTATEKIQGYFNASASWKSSQRELVVAMMNVWYSDDNVLFRQKMTLMTMKKSPIFFEQIIHQGIKEKAFTTEFPKQAAEIIIGMALNLTDSIVEMLINPANTKSDFEKLEQILGAYADAVERILGAQPNSLKIFEKSAFNEWFNYMK